jgi:hypothetical protein
MRIVDIVPEVLLEGVVQIWGRAKGKVVKKYRCTSGSRKSRIVAKPETCNAAKKIGSMISMKKARRQRSAVSQVKSARTKRAGAHSQRIAQANKGRTQKRYDKASQRRTKSTAKGSRKIPKRNVSKTLTKAFKPKKTKAKRIK